MKDWDWHLFGHIVTVDTVEEIDIYVNTKITVADGSSRENAKKEIKEALNNYMLELRKQWEETSGLIIRKAQVETLILNVTGVIDVTNTTINNKISNIALDENQIPILKEVVIS